MTVVPFLGTGACPLPADAAGSPALDHFLEVARRLVGCLPALAEEPDALDAAATHLLLDGRLQPMTAMQELLGGAIASPLARIDIEIAIDQTRELDEDPTLPPETPA